MTVYSSYAGIRQAELDWIIEDGVEIPVSRQFGDVYFSKANGLAETRHVFLQGNELPQRLAQLQSHQYFCVGETGFGTGLNILALWQLWQQCRPDNHSRLHVITVEKFPLSRADLQRALAAWPELADLAQKLLAQYPVALPGCHRLVFARERFSIDLWLGDAADCLPEIQTSHPVDAWFMDGFAPKCNPELWQDHILKHLIRLSGSGTTFASFSVAGVVKQGLRAYGITVTRPAGFGRKREMLKACWTMPATQDALIAKASINPTPKIAIIGAGIAGLSMAHALATRGYACDLYDQRTPLAGASGNPRALLAPKLVSLAKFSDNLLNLGCLFSLRYWQQFSGVVSQTGIMHILDKRAEQELAKAHAYPPESIEAVNALSIHALTQPKSVEHWHKIWFKQAGLLNPHALAQVVLNHPLVQHHHAEILQLQPVKPSSMLTPLQPIQWQLSGCEQHVLGSYDHVIICSALNSPVLCPNLPALKPIRGQVSWFKSATPSALPLPMTYGGYIASLNHPESEATVLLGASFVRQDDQTDIRLADHQHNLDLISAIAPDIAHHFPDIKTWQGRAAIRAQSPDYLPIVGAVPAMPNVWTLCGLGSKGFSFAPLCAELICAQMLEEVWPLATQASAGLDAHRFA